MKRPKRSVDGFSKAEATRRFEAALRGARIVGPNPEKTTAVKRGRRKKDEDPMPNDPKALIAWGKRNIKQS